MGVEVESTEPSVQEQKKTLQDAKLMLSRNKPKPEVPPLPLPQSYVENSGMGMVDFMPQSNASAPKDVLGNWNSKNALAFAPIDMQRKGANGLQGMVEGLGEEDSTEPFVATPKTMQDVGLAVVDTYYPEWSESRRENLQKKAEWQQQAEAYYKANEPTLLTNKELVKAIDDVYGKFADAPSPYIEKDWTEDIWERDYMGNMANIDVIKENLLHGGAGYVPAKFGQGVEEMIHYYNTNEKLGDYSDRSFQKQLVDSTGVDEGAFDLPFPSHAYETKEELDAVIAKTIEEENRLQEQEKELENNYYKTNDLDKALGIIAKKLASGLPTQPFGMANLDGFGFSSGGVFANVAKDKGEALSKYLAAGGSFEEAQIYANRVALRKLYTSMPLKLLKDMDPLVIEKLLTYDVDYEIVEAIEKENK